MRRSDIACFLLARRGLALDCAFEPIHTACWNVIRALRHFAGGAVAGQARNEGMLTNSFMAPVRRRRERGR